MAGSVVVPSTAIQADLVAALVRFGSATGQCERTDALGGLLNVLFAPGPAGGPALPAVEALPQILAANTFLREAVFNRLAAVLGAAGGADLFADSGLPTARSFLSEASDRLARRLLPEPRADHDLAALVRWLVLRSPVAEGLARLDTAQFGDLVQVLKPEDRPDLWTGLGLAAADGFRLLAARVLDTGLHPRLRDRLAGHRISESPAHRLFTASAALADAWDAGLTNDQAEWLAAVDDCQRAVAGTRAQHGAEGVSVEVVFSLDVLESCLRRMRLIAELFVADAERRTSAPQQLVVELAAAVHRDRSLRDLARRSLRLLHRRIVDRSGATGEHYIAHNRREYWQIWRAAAGGGLLTTATAAIKLGSHQICHALHVAPVVEGLAYSLNYAASFLALQHLHLMLATKQPAMTAAALAAIVRDRRGDDRIEQIAAYTQRICASQVAAATANVATVAVGCFAFDLAWTLVGGGHFLAAAEAEAIYTNFSPLSSLTLFYAALTGVILWLSSLFGGAFDNWVAWHRLPQACLDRGWRRIGDGLRQHAAGWGTNVSLGLMLGFTPVLGTILGLPLDVRHVTLSTGQLALACASQPDWWRDGFVLLAGSGIAVMFVLNLSVSFLLSLFTAVRAYDLPAGELYRLLRLLVSRACSRPLAFVLPPSPHQLNQ
ncbi:hypothetical protein LBMAG53_07740 [Planctomycetota bacterium]|nr:hypothetical protein LBMAG53_07740 [Planctomycetota bacterium]